MFRFVGLKPKLLCFFNIFLKKKERKVDKFIDKFQQN
jgi:hypothetical protein